MNESFEELIEISWRRKLTPEEEVQLQSWLASHPADAERWEAEAGLSQALEKLRPIEPSSNFTSQVLRLVELDQQAQTRQARAPGFIERLRRFIATPTRGLAWAVMLILVGGLGYHRYQENSRHQIEQGVRAISTMATVTAPEAFEDFEIVREFSQVLTDQDRTDETLFVLLGQ